jgi:hypothetical protein
MEIRLKKYKTVANLAMASDGHVEAELDELTRRYKLMEGDRKAYAEEVQVRTNTLRPHAAGTRA